MENLNVAGHNIDPKAERKFLLIAAAVGIVGFIMLLRKPSSGGSSVGSTTDLTGSSGGGGSTSGIDLSGIQSTISDLSSAVTDLKTKSQTKVDFKLTRDNSTGLEYQNTTGSGKSGSGGLSFGPFSIGGGGSSSKTQDQHIKTSNQGLFTSDISVEGGTPEIIAGVEQFLLNMAGSQDQQNQAVLSQQAAGYPFISGGKQLPVQNYHPTNPQFRMPLEKVA